MNYTKKDLIIFALIFVLFYLHFNKKETFTNPGFDNKGNLVVPGNLKVLGGTELNNGAVVNGKWLTVNSETVFNKLMHIKGPKSWSYINHPDGNIYLRGSVVVDGYQGSGKNLTVLGNTNIKSIVNKDTEAIRNLSDLANQLTKNGKLVVPGGLEIGGNLTIKGKYLTVEGESVFHKTMHVRGPKGWSYPNHHDGNIYLRGNVVIDGYGGTGKNLTVNGTSNLNGTSNFNGESVFHKTMHVRGPKGWSYPNHSDGNIYLRGNVVVDGFGGSGKNLTVSGNTTVGGNATVNGTSNFNGESVFHKTMHVRGPKGWSYPNHTDGNIYLRGNVVVDGFGGSGKNLTVGGNINQNGKNVISTGDGVRIKKGNLYLNNTSRKFGDTPGNWSRWSYWSDSHDTGANLQIWKM